MSTSVLLIEGIPVIALMTFITGLNPDNQYGQYLSEYATDYDAYKNLLLDEARQLYDRLIEESMNTYNSEIPSSLRSLQTLTELPASHHSRDRDEDYLSNSDGVNNDLVPITIVCDSTDPQLQYKENDVNITSRCILVGKNEINLQI
jgi:hypothetical protein